MANEIRGRWPLPAWALWLWVAFAVGWVGWAVLVRDYGRIVMALLWVGSSSVAWWWGNCRVATEGVELSWPEHKRVHLDDRMIPWDRIEGVEQPDQSSYARIRLTGGRVLTLIGIDNGLSGKVAALGGKELLAPKPSVSKKTDRPPTDQEVERDLRRREETLASGSAELNAELDKIRKRRTDG